MKGANITTPKKKEIRDPNSKCQTIEQREQRVRERLSSTV